MLLLHPLSTTHAFIHLSASRFTQAAALVPNALKFSLSIEQNNKSAGYMKQIIPVEALLYSLISFSTKSKQGACLLSPLYLSLIHPYEANQQTESKQ
jgi:hypothetical protein